MTNANLTAVRSILHHHILKTLRNGARTAEYVSVTSGAIKSEINSLVKRGVLARCSEGGRTALHLSRVGEIYLMAANAALGAGGVQ